MFRMPKVQLQHGHFLPPSGDWEGAPPPRPMGPPLIDPQATGPNQTEFQKSKDSGELMNYSNLP